VTEVASGVSNPSCRCPWATSEHLSVRPRFYGDHGIDQIQRRISKHIRQLRDQHGP
jgi:hypothetical protein